MLRGVVVVVAAAGGTALPSTTSVSATPEAEVVAAGKKDSHTIHTNEGTFESGRKARGRNRL